MNLRAVGKAAELFNEVQSRVALDKALELMNIHSFQIVFIEEELFNSSADFLEKAKASQGGRTSTYILLRKAKEFEAHSVVSNMLLGIDSLLNEPFSIDSLQEIIRISFELNNKRNAEYRKKLIEIALVDVLTYIHSMADNISRLRTRRASARSLDKLRATISACAEADPDLYFEVLIERFLSLDKQRAGSPPPSAYSGASQRIRDKFNRASAERLLSVDKEEG